GFNGFDYHANSPTSGHYLDVGDQYYSLGFVSNFGTLLSGYVDTGTREYTYYMFNLPVSTVEYWDGTTLVVDFDNTNGRTRYYEDAISGGTHGTYGAGPPNATAPSTFTDGTIALGGHTYNFVIDYDFSAGQGDFSGNMDLDEGTDLIYIPASQRPGWILGG